MMIQNKDGKTVINARAVPMSALVNMIMRGQEVDGKPVVDKTGFKGNLDLVDMQWAGMLGGMNGGAVASAADVDAPSLFTALEETLGLKLVATKGPVEVVVIDSIEQPTEN
jgi:bla regulator protein BlaR1